MLQHLSSPVLLLCGERVETCSHGQRSNKWAWSTTPKNGRGHLKRRPTVRDPKWVWSTTPMGVAPSDPGDPPGPSRTLVALLVAMGRAPFPLFSGVIFFFPRFKSPGTSLGNPCPYLGRPPASVFCISLVSFVLGQIYCLSGFLIGSFLK